MILFNTIFESTCVHFSITKTRLGSTGRGYAVHSLLPFTRQLTVAHCGPESHNFPLRTILRKHNMTRDPCHYGTAHVHVAVEKTVSADVYSTSESTEWIVVDSQQWEVLQSGVRAGVSTAHRKKAAYYSYTGLRTWNLWDDPRDSRKSTEINVQSRYWMEYRHEDYPVTYVPKLYPWWLTSLSVTT
jgi:hypothetical protein